jgi:undecaprenyl-diphosphatase
MIPAVIIGFIFEDSIQILFKNNLMLIGSMLIVTGVLLFLTDKTKNKNKNINIKTAFLIGVAQAIALLPGLSRSGATISVAVLLGINKKKAAKFSFLMVIPIIIGKIIKDFISGDISYEKDMFIVLIIGFLSALITGFIACKWMIKLVQNSNLKYFSLYCFIIGLICMMTYL